MSWKRKDWMMAFEVPLKKNKKLEKLVQRINDDQELQQLWKCANINAVDRSGISDHGAVHIRIVANAALRFLRLIMKSGVEPNIVSDHGLEPEDAELVVIAAAALHDTGISIHRDHHERYSLFIGFRKARELFEGLYDEPALTSMVSDTLHAVIAHDASEKCFTIEAGCLKVADATDMTQGRSRIPFEAGQINIHSVSAQSVSSVDISKGEERPVQIDITMENYAGVFQVDELLKAKVKNSSISKYIEITTHLESDQEERRLLERFLF